MEGERFEYCSQAAPRYTQKRVRLYRK